MAKKCDFYTDKGRKYWCVIKDCEISEETYKTYCQYDEAKNCPIYLHYKKENKLS